MTSLTVSILTQQVLKREDAFKEVHSSRMYFQLSIKNKAGMKQGTTYRMKWENGY